MRSDLNVLLFDFFISLKASGVWAERLSVIFEFVLFVLLILLTGKLASISLVRIIDVFVVKTKTLWDDCFKESHFFKRLSTIIPVVLARLLLGGVFKFGAVVEDYIGRVILACFAIIAVRAITAFLDGINLIYQYEAAEISKRKPIKGQIQLVNIFLYIVGAALAITALVKVSPVGILSGVGAMSAVLLLVFKDSILGFVSSIQLSANDMVRIGDWIEMPSYNADGSVIDITLQSVKVQNWDNSITTIPIYSLVSDSFKNWRGMSESKGRRIKRSLYIDMRSVHFLSDEEIERLSKISLISDYIKQKLLDIESDNKKRGIDAASDVSGRRLTNLGTYRAYAEAYISNIKEISRDMTCMVRYLQPDQNGLQMELYLFSADKEWVSYERIQSDIIDHLLASMPVFNLRVFQNLCGGDLEMLRR